ncbi:MAG: lamin tail domain-containing protein [bacterium]
MMGRRDEQAKLKLRLRLRLRLNLRLQPGRSLIPPAIWLGLCCAMGAVPAPRASAWKSGQSPVVINEVLYDPAGKDAGLEFVELKNCGGQALALDGWALETGNGSYADRWRREWTGGAEDTLPAGGFFTIGEDMVSPAPDAVAELDLQNGPDACRLLSPAGACDLVGWGDHTYSEYFEGAPAPSATAGSSLGRDPDGTDTDTNGDDFAVFPRPSPGAFNHPRCDLWVSRAGPSRYASMSAATIDLVCLVANGGTAECGADARVWARVGTARDSCLVSSPVPAGETARVILSPPNPGGGLHPITVWLAAAEDAWPANDTLITSLVVPPPPLVVNEIMFKPAGLDCEWIEVLNRSPGDLSLTGWTLEDSGGKARIVTDGEAVMAPGSFLVLVEDPAGFEQVCPESLGCACLRPAGGWPSLNDTDGPLGFADAVCIRDPHGAAVDSVAYRESWARAGVSVERIDPAAVSRDPANWSPHCGHSGGSPGMPNSVAFILPSTGKLMELSAEVISPDGDGHDDVLAIAIRAGGTVRLRVFDVNGRPVRSLLDGERVESGRVTFWDGRDAGGAAVPVGVYILLAEVTPPGGGGALGAKRPVVVVRKP